MAEAKLQVGAFLHSFAKESLEASIIAAGKSGLGLRVVQIGPVDDTLLIGDGVSEAREKLVSLLNEQELKVALGCACFEPGQARRGGVEVYNTIEHIVRTGGLGYIEPDKTDILKQRMEVYRNHLDFLVYLREKGLISQDETGLSSHFGFIDRELAQRAQVKELFTEIAQYAKVRKLYLAIETGSEKIEYTIAFIREVGLPNVGLNLDFANHILYRTQSSEDVLNVLGQDDNYKLVLGLHAKDARLNPQARISGKAEGEWQAADVRFGTGIVPWKTIIPTLYQNGYRGPVIIERESQDVDPALMTAAANIPAEQAKLIANARRGDIEYARDRLLEMKACVTR